MVDPFDPDPDATVAAATAAYHESFASSAEPVDIAARLSNVKELRGGEATFAQLDEMSFKGEVNDSVGRGLEQPIIQFTVPEDIIEGELAERLYPDAFAVAE